MGTHEQPLAQIRLSRAYAFPMVAHEVTLALVRFFAT